MSFLTNRQQHVSINGFGSSKLDVKYEDTLFTLYIKDHRYCVKKSTASHFADITYNRVLSLERNLSQHMKYTYHWLKSLNVDKS